MLGSYPRSCPVAFLRAMPAALVLIAVSSIAGGQERVPRNPPEPFRVFVYTIESTEAESKARLEEALPMVRERVKRRRRWFQLADSRETADITMRINHYRVAHPNYHRSRPRKEAMEDCHAMEFHSVDAVALAGDLRAQLSGLDYRCIEEGPSLRNTASRLAEELERFSKENYSTLERLRATAGSREPSQGDRTWR